MVTRYKVLRPFQGNDRKYYAGELLPPRLVEQWKNVRSLLASGYLERVHVEPEEERKARKKVEKQRRKEEGE